MNTSNISKSHLTKSDDIIIPIHRDINGFWKSLDQNYDEIVKDRIKIIRKLVQQKQEKNLILDEDNSILDMIRTDNSKNIKKIDCNKILVLPSISRKENMTYAMTLKEFLEDENIDPFIELCKSIDQGKDWRGLEIGNLHIKQLDGTVKKNPIYLTSIIFA